MNARFVNKGLLRSDLNTLNALIKYFENGGGITVVEPGKRNCAKSAPAKKTANSKKRG